MKKLSPYDKIPKPPHWAVWLLEQFCAPHLLEEMRGDLEELFIERAETLGLQTARYRYVQDVLSLVRPFILKREPSSYSPITSLDMITNYLKIAYRHLFKHKVYSFINIGGLAVGMTVAMLIGLWMYDELSYDKYHQNYSRIARVMQNQTFDGEIRTWFSQSMQLAPELRSSYGSNFTHVITATFPGESLLTVGDKTLLKSGSYMEAAAPDMLSLWMLRGSHDGLKDPHSILLSASVAKAFFGDENPIGQLIEIDNKLPVKVTGVYEDIPDNSSFADLNFIAPWDLYATSENLAEKVGWGNSWFQTFVQIAPHTSMEAVSANIKDAKSKKVEQGDARYKPQLFLHPMSKWHLYFNFENGISTGGGIEYVWLFGIIGVFVLLLACINFMNLSTARSEKRAKEVGIRKAVGSVRRQLIGQFLSESLLVAFFSFVLCIVLVLLLLPLFNEITGKQLVLFWNNPFFWLCGLGFTGLTGVLAGSYPAFYLSSFNPVKSLKGTFKVGKYASVPRKALVVLQFTVSVTLIIGTIIIFEQIQYVKNRPVGYNRDGVVTIFMRTKEVKDHYQAFRNELLGTGAVSEVSQSANKVTNVGVTNGGFQWRGKDPAMQDELFTLALTHEFGKTVDWTISEGRDFSTSFITDSSAFILNETAVKYMGFENPIGETIKAFGRTYTVIGVVKDMVMQSIYAPARPMVFYIDTFGRNNFINIKINPGTGVSNALTKIEAVFKKHNPAIPFEYEFADEDFAAKYQAEERVGTLSSIFALLAIFISCLGLFGLASFTAERRTKEIGIRKVLGASVLNVWGLLSRDFIYLVLIAFGIATPVAYYFLSDWLQSYEYRTTISPWIFVLTGLAAIVITLCTVSFQAIKAALANPVKSLRNE